MLHTLCDGPVLEKTRYFVPCGAFTWEVDVYDGALAGLILTEIELEHEDQAFTVPAWVGREVTHESRYRKANLLKFHANLQEPPGKRTGVR
jgi:CYTH domain-containing protein